MIRAESLRQIETAQQDLSAQLDALRRADTSHLREDVLSSGSAKLQQLSALRDQLVGGAKDVTALRASIASAVADIRAYTSDVRSTVATAEQNISSRTMSIALQQASSAARATTTSFVRDYYDNHIFDSYLHFASTEDEEEYRRREEQHKKDIEKARAEHTPQGDLTALKISIEQMKDAGAHGANRSPEYQQRYDKLNAAAEALTTELAKTPNKAKQQAAVADPLDAAKPTANVSPELIANLRASGIAVPSQDGTGHGITSRPDQSALSRG